MHKTMGGEVWECSPYPEFHLVAQAARNSCENFESHLWMTALAHNPDYGETTVSPT